MCEASALTSSRSSSIKNTARSLEAHSNIKPLVVQLHGDNRQRLSDLHNTHYRGSQSYGMYLHKHAYVELDGQHAEWSTLARPSGRLQAEAMRDVELLMRGSGGVGISDKHIIPIDTIAIWRTRVQSKTRSLTISAHSHLSHIPDCPAVSVTGI